MTFYLGYDYCVGVSTTSSSQTSPTVTSTVTSSTSSTTSIPTQSGIASNCDDIVEAKSGDYCYEFAQDNNITTSQLYEWNSILGPSGQNCSNEFFASYGYCVGVSD